MNTPQGSPLRPGQGAGAAEKAPPASPSKGALGRRLVEAKLAEADALRRLKVARRAEEEFQTILARRDKRVAELKAALEATKKEKGGGGSGAFGSPAEKAPPPPPPRASPGRVSRAARETAAEDGAETLSVAALAARAALRRGAMVEREGERPSEARGSRDGDPKPAGEDPVDPETLVGPGIVDDDDALESGSARLRVERLRALAEVERLDAGSARRARTRRPRTRWTPSATSSPRSAAAGGPGPAADPRAGRRGALARVNAVVAAAASVAGAALGTTRRRRARFGSRPWRSSRRRSWRPGTRFQG